MGVVEVPGTAPVPQFRLHGCVCLTLFTHTAARDCVAFTAVFFLHSGVVCARSIPFVRCTVRRNIPDVLLDEAAVAMRSQQGVPWSASCLRPCGKMTQRVLWCSS